MPHRGRTSPLTCSPAPEYGLFTEHLLGGLCGGVASDDGLVRIFDLFEYLQPRVTKVQPSQHPLFKGELEENFPVALYRGGARGVVPKVEGEFRYDAYISYVDKGADAEFVWDTLVPKLEGAGLKVAVSGDSAEPGRSADHRRGASDPPGEANFGRALGGRTWPTGWRTSRTCWARR